MQLPPSQRIANRVRDLAHSQRISQAEIGAALGISQAAVSRRILGRTPFDVDELHTLAVLLGTPATDLAA